MLSAKWWSICFGLNMLMSFLTSWALTWTVPRKWVQLLVSVTFLVDCPTWWYRHMLRLLPWQQTGVVSLRLGLLHQSLGCGDGRDDRGYQRCVKSLTHLTNYFNTLRPKQNDLYFEDDIFKRISLNENFWIWNKISLKYVPLGLSDNMAALVQIMACCWTGNKPLSEPMVASFADAYICVTRPQWVVAYLARCYRFHVDL